MRDYPKRAYGLSYRPSSKKGKTRTPPAVLVTIQKQDIPAFEVKLDLVLGTWFRDEDVVQKVAEHLQFPREETTFNHGNRSRDDRRFGFDNSVCEYDTEEGRVFEVRFLGPEYLLAQAMTVEILFETLGLFHSLGNERSSSNHEQLLELGMGYRPGEKPYPMWGDVHSTLTLWLKERYDSLPRAHGFGTCTRQEPAVTAAMRDAFMSLAPKDMRILTRECAMGIHEDGRLEVSTFGGVAGVIPSGGHFADPSKGCEYPSRLSSDNIDSPLQQMTNLAGLAALFELAAKDLG